MSNNRLHKYIINFEGLEPWTLEALLKIIEEQSKANGLEVTNATCGLCVELEGFDDQADFDAFRGNLKAKRLGFSYELEKDI
jgi:hypothetical protein